MRVEFMMLADAATADPTGKVNILGGSLGRIASSQLPAVHRPISFVARLDVTPDELREGQSVRLLIMDPDGEPLGQPVALEMASSEPPFGDLLPGESLGIIVVVELLNLQLTKYGLHRVVLTDSSGDTELGSIPLAVVAP